MSIIEDNLKADGVKSAVSDNRGGILYTEGNMGTNANTQSHNLLTADGKDISRDVSGIALSMNMLGSDPGDAAQIATHKKMIHGQNASSIQLGMNSLHAQRINHTFDTKSHAQQANFRDDELQRAYHDLQAQNMHNRSNNGMMLRNGSYLAGSGRQNYFNSRHPSSDIGILQTP